MPAPLKRQYDDIVAAALGNTTDDTPAKKRRKRSSSATLSTVDKPIAAAKLFTRAISPYMDISAAMLYGPEHHWGTPVVPVASNTVTIPASELERQQNCIAAFDKLFSVAPELLEPIKQMYLDIATKPHQWTKMVKLMQDAATSARTVDTNTLKHCLNYLLPNPAKDVILPPIPKQESKSDRGLVHPMLRYFILPWVDRLKLPQFPPANAPREEPDVEDADVPPATNEFLVLVVAGRVDLKATQFPSFFYEEGTYDPKELDKGLLRGDLVLRVLRHIWTGPSSALFGLDDGIPAVCNARYHATYKVDREMVAYAGVQARTMLGTADWKRRHGSYNYEDLFNSILTLFADPEDHWKKETLDWFQKGVFGTATMDAHSDPEAEPNAAVSIMAQRAARRAAAST
ncbi:hypothetical protein DFH09DRAFT_1189310 [Mycena vulgaris]|nr:hypothetical protein DFH09DRAFT_1189310 [Mycena vulgaris]